jgi:hypothetical protein
MSIALLIDHELSITKQKAHQSYDTRCKLNYVQDVYGFMSDEQLGEAL